MTRVLVAGAEGFIGRHMVRHLLERTDWTVVGLDQRGAACQRWTRGDGRLVAVRCNLASGTPDVLGSLVGSVDYVVNLAADADAARSLSGPSAAMANNVGATAVLLELARTLPGLRRFVQVSSAEVFGTSPQPLSEDSPVRPQNPYAASKAAADALALAYRASFGVPVIVSYTANVFGEGQPAGKLLPAIVTALREGNDVQVMPGLRRFIHADDCASAWLWLLLHAPADWLCCNVAGERVTDHREFADLIAQEVLRLAGVELPVRVGDYVGARPGQIGNVVLDDSRLAVAGWKHPVGLSEGVRRAVEALWGA